MDTIDRAAIDLRPGNPNLLTVKQPSVAIVIHPVSQGKGVIAVDYRGKLNAISA